MRQAEAGYVAALEADPGNVEALHWLGVLAFQAGRPDKAVIVLERAAALRPDDAAFQHNLGQAYLAVRRYADAVPALERASILDPNRAETLLALGLAHLARQSAGDAEAAVFALRQANLAGMDSAELHHNLGVALLAAGRLDESIAASRKAIEKNRNFAEAHYYLAVAQRNKGNAVEARRALTSAVECEPAYAPGWHALAVMEAEDGRVDQSVALFRKAIAAKPEYAPAYQGLGQVLQRAGRRSEALQAFGQAVRASRGEFGATHTPPLGIAIAELERKLTLSEDAAKIHFALAAKSGVSVPPAQVPAQAVASLFDKYADNFDHHLRDKLGYHVPEMIADAVAALKPAQPLDVLDLGCGTGLCGQFLRPLARTLAGVDLSPAMIEKTRERGIYDQLEVGELVASLRKASHAYDLLVAADVLIYIGDLSPVFEAARAALRPGGWFVYSVEAGGGDRYLLQKNLRFLHAKSYLQRLGAMYGFEEKSFTTITVRAEADQPVPGYLVVLELPGD